MTILNLIETWHVNLVQVFVKFEANVKTSSLINSNISLETIEATPITILDPFKVIHVVDDYTSVTKTLLLNWKPDILVPDKDYRIKFTNFRTVTNQIVPDDFILFDTTDSVIPLPQDIPPVPPPIEIIDYSIVPDIITTAFELDDDDAGNNIIFKLVDSDPINFDAFLPEDYNNGVVILRFTLSPNINFLTSDYILVQKKQIQRRQSRWTTVPVQISLDPDKPWVYIAFPSTDATPLYDTASVVYFEKNFKYRIRLSSEIGV